MITSYTHKKKKKQKKKQTHSLKKYIVTFFQWHSLRLPSTFTITSPMQN